MEEILSLDVGSGAASAAGGHCQSTVEYNLVKSARSGHSKPKKDRIVFECVTTSTLTVPDEVLEFSMLPTGPVLDLARPYEELGMEVGDFSKRMKWEDVRNFFAKHA